MNRRSNDIGELFYPGKKFIKAGYGQAEGWQRNVQFNLQRGIVISIVKEVNNPSYIIPPFSINVKIYGEDISGSNPAADNATWYAPFFSSHIVALPEIGEEVLIIRETTSIASPGYWISRVNNSSVLTRLVAGWFSSASTNRGRIGFDFNINDILEDGPKVTGKRSLPVKPGDVIIQGRSDTFFRQSYNQRSQGGVLELGVRNDRQLFSLTGSASVDETRTNLLHLGNAQLSEATDLETESARKSIESEEGSVQDKDIIVQIADENYVISKESKDKLFKMVLGEKLNDFLGDVTDILREMSSVIDFTFSTLASHTHAVEGQTVKDNVTFPSPLGPLSTEIELEVEKTTSESIPSNPGTQNVSTIANLMRAKVDAVIEKLEDHLSDGNFVN